MSCTANGSMTQHVGGEPIQHGAMLQPERRPPWFKARRTLALAVVVAVLVAAASIAVAIRSSARSTHPEPAATGPRREGDAIVVSAGFRDVAALETVPAVSAPLVPVVNVVGAVEFDPTHVAAVGARAPGVVTHVMHVEGDFVTKGEVLAEIESGGLAQANADLRIAAAEERAAAINAARERDLLARQLTTAREAEVAEAKLEEQRALLRAAKQRVEALGGGRGRDTGISQLRAPAAGVVAQRSIAPGQSVEPGHVAFRVGDVDRLWVLLRVFERHLGTISVGDEVDIHPMADPKKAIPGKVTHVGAVLDPQTRTIDVRVAVADGERLLRPGQSVNATVRASGPARVALAVPSSAITYVDGVPTVFVAESDTRFVPRRVEVGMDAGDQVEIKQGVREGERVVSKNVLAIKSELFR
jgi:cobalt-zinc-cadmium efflux system membrane fusion protein